MTSLKEINLKPQWAPFLPLILKYVAKVVNVPFLNINAGNLFFDRLMGDNSERRLRFDHLFNQVCCQYVIN